MKLITHTHTHTQRRLIEEKKWLRSVDDRSTRAARARCCKVRGSQVSARAEEKMQTEFAKKLRHSYFLLRVGREVGPRNANRTGWMQSATERLSWSVWRTTSKLDGGGLNHRWTAKKKQSSCLLALGQEVLIRKPVVGVNGSFSSYQFQSEGKNWSICWYLSPIFFNLSRHKIKI